MGKFLQKNLDDPLDICGKFGIMFIVPGRKLSQGEHEAVLCNGSTADSDSVCLGSNPGTAAMTRVWSAGFQARSFSAVPLPDGPLEVWLSLVERYVRDVEAAGSNPVTSTTSVTLDTVRAPMWMDARSFLPTSGWHFLGKAGPSKILPRNYGFWGICFLPAARAPAWPNNPGNHILEDEIP